MNLFFILKNYVGVTVGVGVGVSVGGISMFKTTFIGEPETKTDKDG
jgi:hypothetical protein